MSLYLTKKQWKFLFDKYETLERSDFWIYYSKYRKIENITNSVKIWFKRKYKNFRIQGECIIISMTGKNSNYGPKKHIDCYEFTR